MSNTLIVIILIIILVSGTRLQDYKLRLVEIPWWLIVLGGFTVSLLGLFKYNDDRIIFSGCGILLIAKLYSFLDRKNWE
ncbi:MAG: hypothetical protein JW774_04660 [Candidatus Aureabacteria bacterium]|nr:hypothetical protein [Candidatus Auribacterota bacterium]